MQRPSARSVEAQVARVAGRAHCPAGAAGAGQGWRGRCARFCSSGVRISFGRVYVLSQREEIGVAISEGMVFS